jgi:hypothetical protein
MTIKKTMFGRHFTYDYVKRAHMTTNEGTNFHVSAPKAGYIIKHTLKRFFSDGLRYMYVQQLNSCDACIVTTSCVHSRGHFNSTMRLVSYDTVVCEVTFNPHSMVKDGYPYCTIVIGEHWNYSRTTVQHVYKFLRMFGFTNVSISDYAKRDAKQPKDYWYSYSITNNMGNVARLQFASERAICDFSLNGATHFVDRMIRSASDNENIRG